MTVESHPAGETIVRQGEEGDRFYVVGSGVADSYTRGPFDEELCFGEGFGMISSYFKQPNRRHRHGPDRHGTLRPFQGRLPQGPGRRHRASRPGSGASSWRATRGSVRPCAIMNSRFVGKAHLGLSLETRPWNRLVQHPRPSA